MFLTIILSFFYNVFKNLLFLDRQNAGLFGTQTYTRGIDFLLSKNAFNHHHSVLPLQCFLKPSISGLSKLRIVWYSNLRKRYRFSLQQKKATSLICRYGVYGQRLVFNRIERSRKYIKKKWYCTPLSFEDGNESV